MKSEKKINKIAIVGTSPIMVLLYFRLKKKFIVDVYENSKIGGAWYIDRYKNQNYSAHNNVIVPLRDNEEKYIKLINKELKKFECKISKPKGKYDILSKYSPKNIYIHDLSNLFFNFKKICKTLVKKKVTNIKIFNKKILLNKKEYDQVYLPSCFDINRITIEESCFKINSIRSISHHITVVFKKKIYQIFHIVKTLIMYLIEDILGKVIKIFFLQEG